MCKNTAPLIVRTFEWRWKTGGSSGRGVGGRDRETVTPNERLAPLDGTAGGDPKAFNKKECGTSRAIQTMRLFNIGSDRRQRLATGGQRDTTVIAQDLIESRPSKIRVQNRLRQAER